MSASDRELSFPCRRRVDVAWGDVDRMQHVNNVVFFRWMETVRTFYFEQIEFERHVAEGVYPILASIRCDYRAQLRYPDTISVECSITKLGRSSATHAYRVMSEGQKKVVAEGEGTWVCFDYRAQKSLALPAPLVAAMERYEGRSLR
jgi:acyl-CoA thioester hydrolase